MGKERKQANSFTRVSLWVSSNTSQLVHFRYEVQHPHFRLLYTRIRHFEFFSKIGVFDAENDLKRSKISCLWSRAHQKIILTIY